MEKHNRPFLIAITGGIASGKTLVSKWFAEQGFDVYSTDKIAHEIINETEVIQKITQLFGPEIMIDQRINRKKLGEIVFDDSANLEQLNSIMHPLVYNEMNNLILLSKASCLVFEIPLLFENGLQNAFDLTINISADKELQIMRMKKRDNLMEEEILQRVESQMSDFDKQKLADINITNNATEREMFIKLENLLPLIQKLKKKDIEELLKI
ncbi:dephospho-CoA kinase [Candidatus Cloacimonadota bacterium]